MVDATAELLFFLLSCSNSHDTHNLCCGYTYAVFLPLQSSYPCTRVKLLMYKISFSPSIRLLQIFDPYDWQDLHSWNKCTFFLCPCKLQFRRHTRLELMHYISSLPLQFLLWTQFMLLEDMYNLPPYPAISCLQAFKMCFSSVSSFCSVISKVARNYR